MIKLLCIFFIASTQLFAKSSICEQLKLNNCNNSKSSLGRSNSASFPNSTNAAMTNPTAINMDRGFGIESIFNKGVGRYGVVTGSGRVGAAISNSPTGETFFSHYALESANSYRRRRVNGEIYEPDVLSLAGAVNVFGKKKKKGLQLDVGAMYKKNNENEKSYSGYGATLSLNKMFSIGFSKYKDVFYEDNRDQVVKIYDQFGEDSQVQYPDDDMFLTEVNVDVQTMIYGIKFGNIALDQLTIKTTFEDEYEEPTTIKITSASVFYGRWIFSYAQREEISFREQWDGEEFTEEKIKYDVFKGAQYALEDNFLIGVFSNYYLLGELSFGLTLFL